MIWKKKISLRCSSQSSECRLEFPWWMLGTWNLEDKAKAQGIFPNFLYFHIWLMVFGKKRIENQSFEIYVGPPAAQDEFPR